MIYHYIFIYFLSLGGLGMRKMKFTMPSYLAKMKEAISLATRVDPRGEAARVESDPPLLATAEAVRDPQDQILMDHNFEGNHPELTNMDI